MLQIKKSDHLKWKVTIGGSKNAVLPIMAASLLIPGKVVLHNVPEIGDVYTYLDILSEIWVIYSFCDNTLILDSTDLKKAHFDLEKIKKIRVSILLLAPILQRLGEISIPTPGGCNLGARSIESHLEGLKNIGYDIEMQEEMISLSWSSDAGERTINAGFWVTPTENLIVANVLRSGRTTIMLWAIEPHVMNLIDFLRAAWANISIRYDNTIIIDWVSALKTDIDFEVISDYIQSGTYMIMWALAAEEYITIEKACVDDLYVFIQKMREAWVRIDIQDNDTLRVYRASELKAVDIQTNIFPGFPTDLQSPFALLMTQATGSSMIHEVLFEGRLGWTIELEKMWVPVNLLNRHECEIKGPTALIGTTVASWDLRAWAAMVIAGLIASGQTTITQVEYIYRWYDKLVWNLKSLGADIREIK
jgi:UDP-N-acetylglucosamine 1-carboxyvinyltransferase